MAKAIKEAHRITGLSGPVVFNLPAGLEQSTWSRVQTLIGENATPMSKDIAAGDEQVFSVQQLRLSGGVADVDVVYPERGVYQLISADSMFARPFITTPGVPAERVAALRAAFDKTMVDADFLRDAEKSHSNVAPVSGETLAEIVKLIIDTPPAIVEQANQWLSPPK